MSGEISKRHQKIGFKQTLQPHWMERVVQMMFAEMTEADIRADLKEYLSTQKTSGGIGERGQKTFGMSIVILSAWFSPEKELLEFRNEALSLAKKLPPKEWLPLHWAIISASYPFWFNVAKQVGRLLNLQEKITQPQIFNRLKEIYGDRPTVARNARYVVRSFVAWGVLKDTEIRGCYEKASPIQIQTPEIVTLLFESALHANVEGRSTINEIQNNPVFFPFQLPSVSGHLFINKSSRVEVGRFGVDEELLRLK